MSVETSSSRHYCRNHLPKLSMLTPCSFFGFFDIDGPASGSNIRAFKPHHHCTIAENLSRNSHCLHNAQISLSFPSTATSSGSNMCALKPHHHCTVAENLSRKFHCLHNAQISVSFTSTATASGSNMCALKPHHLYTVAENLLQLSHCFFICGLDQECSFFGFFHVNGPASGSNIRAFKPHHHCTIAEKPTRNSHHSHESDLKFNVFVHVKRRAPLDLTCVR